MLTIIFFFYIYDVETNDSSKNGVKIKFVTWTLSIETKHCVGKQVPVGAEGVFLMVTTPLG